MGEQAFVQGPGVVSGYSWIEDRRAFISAVLPILRRTVAGQRVLVSSFDSGRMRPSAEELEQGWSQHPAGACSPPLSATVEIPWEQFDEWWVFPSGQGAAAFPAYEPFVNQHGWSLQTPAALTASFDDTWEKDVFDWLPAVQGRFWALVRQHRPTAYIANGDRVIVATSRPDVIAGTKWFLESTELSLRR